MEFCAKCGLEIKNCYHQNLKYDSSREVELYLEAAKIGGKRIRPGLPELAGPFQALDWIGSQVKLIFPEKF